MNSSSFYQRLKPRAWAAFFGLLLLGAAPAFALPTIIIDAGHGGHDLGADESLVYEKHINLDVARRLQRSLEELGFRTVLTRETDDFIPLDTRASIANKQRNAIFVSVHFNSSWKTKVSGIETFHYDSKSRELAAMVQRYLIKNVGAEDRGVKTASFVVLRKTRHPAVLVEGGFVSNDKERDAMMDPLYRQVIADSVARGVVDYAKAHRF